MVLFVNCSVSVRVVSLIFLDAGVEREVEGDVGAEDSHHLHGAGIWEEVLNGDDNDSDDLVRIKTYCNSFMFKVARNTLQHSVSST